MGRLYSSSCFSLSHFPSSCPHVRVPLFWGRRLEALLSCSHHNTSKVGQKVRAGPPCRLLRTKTSPLLSRNLRKYTSRSSRVQLATLPALEWAQGLCSGAGLVLTGMSEGMLLAVDGLVLPSWHNMLQMKSGQPHGPGRVCRGRGSPCLAGCSTPSLCGDLLLFLEALRLPLAVLQHRHCCTSVIPLLSSSPCTPQHGAVSSASDVQTLNHSRGSVPLHASALHLWPCPGCSVGPGIVSIFTTLLMPMSREGQQVPGSSQPGQVQQLRVGPGSPPHPAQYFPLLRTAMICGLASPWGSPTRSWLNIYSVTGPLALAKPTEPLQTTAEVGTSQELMGWGYRHCSPRRLAAC